MAVCTWSGLKAKDILILVFLMITKQKKSGNQEAGKSGNQKSGNQLEETKKADVMIYLS